MRILIAILAVFFSASSHSWEYEGHRIVADIASRYLTPEARKQVSLLLKGDLLADGQASNRTTLGEIASWPDEIKAYDWGKALGAWHYVDIPVCGAADPSQYCPDGICVSVQLEREIAILKDRKAPLLDRNQALKWVVHLVGDIHEPLHAADHDDKGGTDVQVSFPTAGIITLHRLWDDAMVRQMLNEAGGETSFRAVPIRSEDRRGWEKGTVKDWITESYRLGVNLVYPKLPGFSCSGKITGIVAIDDAYYAEAKPVIESGLRKAGVRLAKVLNDALGR